MPALPEHIATIDGLSHAQYDQALVRAFQKGSLWTQASPEPPPTELSVQQLYDHTRHRLQAAVLQLPGKRIRQQDVQHSPALDLVAFETLNAGAKRTHLRQWPTDNMITYLREIIRASVSGKRLWTQNNQSPLWGRGTPEKSVDGTHDGYVIDLNAPHYSKEVDLLRRIAGGNLALRDSIDDIRALLEKAVPFLLTIDRTHLLIGEEDLRRKIYDVVATGEFGPAEREQVLNIVTERWLELTGEMDPAMIRIIRDVQQSRHAADRRAEIADWSHQQVKDALRKLSVQPPRISLEEMKEVLILRETDRLPQPDGTEFDSIDVDTLLEYCCEGIHRPNVTVTPELRERVLRRLTALEFRMIDHSTKIDVEDVNKLILAFRNIVENLDLQYREHPGIYCAITASACRSEKASADFIRNSI